jgi:hypothetical protein
MPFYVLKSTSITYSVRIVEKCPDIPVAVVQYTFTHKQYTERTMRQNNNNYKGENVRLVGPCHVYYNVLFCTMCVVLLKLFLFSEISSAPNSCEVSFDMVNRTPIIR